MMELNRQVRDLYKAYQHKPLRAETALEIVSDFAMDVINVFGDELQKDAAPQADWQTFAPFEFILELNTLLGRYKNEGEESLSDSERTMLHDHHVLLGMLIRSSLSSHPDSFPDEEHFQIPQAVARDLVRLNEFS